MNTNKYQAPSYENIKDMVQAGEWMLLSVPFEEKEIVKAKGAWFSPDLKMWYSKTDALSDYRMHKASIPFEDKDVAKKRGAQWNAQMKFWSFPDKNRDLFSKWASTTDIFGPVSKVAPMQSKLSFEKKPVVYDSDSDTEDIMTPLPYQAR